MVKSNHVKSGNVPWNIDASIPNNLLNLWIFGGFQSRVLPTHAAMDDHLSIETSKKSQIV